MSHSVSENKALKEHVMSTFQYLQELLKHHHEAYDASEILSIQDELERLLNVPFHISAPAVVEKLSYLLNAVDDLLTTQQERSQDTIHASGEMGQLKAKIETQEELIKDQKKVIALALSLENMSVFKSEYRYVYMLVAAS